MGSNEQSLFYGWIVVAASFFAMTAHACFFSFGVFYKPLMDQFGWTTSEVALAPSIVSFMYLASVIPMSSLYQRLNVRYVVLIGGILMGSGLVLSSQVTSLWQLYLFYGVLAGAGTSTIWVPFTSTIMRWFTRRRGLAMAVALSGSGVGSLLMAPLLAYMIVTFDWRMSFLVAGGIVFLLMSSAAVVIRGGAGGNGLETLR